MLSCKSLQLVFSSHSSILLNLYQPDVCGKLGIWWIWVLGSYAGAPMFANYPLFSNAMITFMLVDGVAAWPGVGLSWLSLFGSWGLLCGGLSVSGLPCSGLLLFGQGTWEPVALGFRLQFLMVFSAFFEWLWLNSYGNAFS